MFKYYFCKCKKQQISKGALRSKQKLMLNEVIKLKFILRVLKRLRTEVLVSSSNCCFFLKMLVS